MHIDYFKKIFAGHPQHEFLTGEQGSHDYTWLLSRIDYWRVQIEHTGISRGNVVVVQADYTAEAIALLLALIDVGAIVVPLSATLSTANEHCIQASLASHLFRLTQSHSIDVTRLPGHGQHRHYSELRDRGHPGLVIFTSGSSGPSKAAVHDLTVLLKKFSVRRHCLRTIPFLLFDHVGGLNTLFYCLSNAGCIITINKRTPEAVLEAIERYRVELLPTSPSFLNLVLLSEAYNHHDTSSLTTISYGTEPMPQSTLSRLTALFPHVRFLQTYGLTEIGVMRSKSRESNSLWVQLGGEGISWRVIDGLLEVKTRSGMLGYLNAPSPYTADGWFQTQDEVEVDGEYLKILGRRTDLINVGGEKVCPTQVESSLLELDEVADVTVYGESNPIIGQIVCADVVPNAPINESELQTLVKNHCLTRLKRHEIPVKIKSMSKLSINDRFKKSRLNPRMNT